jgi:peptidoglycan/xylan/chitin deacetylase (PgdA/CDA1 family)
MKLRVSQKTHLPILTYHQIGGSPGSGISVSVETFSAQMQLLYDNGYRTISLEEAAGFIESKNSPVYKAVVITFDDGFKNIHTHAYPILQKFGFTATVFLVADFLGTDNNWSENKDILSSPLLGLDDIVAMPNLSYGSHTLSHRYLTRLSESEVADEIVSSRKKLQDKLGIPIQSFCYPYGDYNESIVQMVRQAGYISACSTRKGNRHSLKERFFLKRIPVTEITLKKFRYRLSSLYDWEYRE